jgi:hypothetical protein
MALRKLQTEHPTIEVVQCVRGSTALGGFPVGPLSAPNAPTAVIQHKFRAGRKEMVRSGTQTYRNEYASTARPQSSKGRLVPLGRLLAVVQGLHSASREVSTPLLLGTPCCHSRP